MGNRKRGDTAFQEGATRASGGRCLRTLAVALAFAAGLITLVSATSVAAPQGPWVLPAADVSVPGQDADAPELAVGPDGSATVVWTRDGASDDTLKVASRPPGGAFGAPVDLTGSFVDAAGPAVAIGSDGTTTVAWLQSDGSNQVVKAATRPPGGVFQNLTTLSQPGQDAANPRIAIAADGTATAVWQRSDGANQVIQAATRPPGGTFAVAEDLSEPGQDAFLPQIAFDPDGTSTVVWRRSNGSNQIAQATTRPAGGSFGPAENLSQAGQGVAGGPSIAIAANGDTTVVWARSNGSNNIAQAVTRPDGGAFSTAVDLSAVGASTFFPGVTAAPDGTTTAVWLRFGTDNVTQAATMPPGGTFGAPVDLSGSGVKSFDPKVASGPDGTTTVVWRTAFENPQTIQASTRPPGGQFGLPVVVSAEEEFLDSYSPQVAVGPDGAATAVWLGTRVGDLTYEPIQSASTQQPSPLVEIERTGSGSGSVTSTPAGIDCGLDCAENFLSYTEVTLTATPESGSVLAGWGGACEGTAGNSCSVTVLEAVNATASFDRLEPKLKVTKLKPKKPKVKRGGKTRIKVSIKNTGKGAASNTKLCVKPKGPAKKALKPVGKRCFALGSTGAGKSRTKAFRLRATSKARRGKKYKLQFTVSASGAKTAKAAVSLKVR